MLTTNLKAYKVTGKQKKYCMWTFKNTNLTTMAQLTLTDNTAMFWSYIKKCYIHICFTVETNFPSQ